MSLSHSDHAKGMVQDYSKRESRSINIYIDTYIYIYTYILEKGEPRASLFGRRPWKNMLFEEIYIFADKHHTK